MQEAPTINAMAQIAHNVVKESEKGDRLKYTFTLKDGEKTRNAVLTVSVRSCLYGLIDSGKLPTTTVHVQVTVDGANAIWGNLHGGFHELAQALRTLERKESDDRGKRNREAYEFIERLTRQPA